MKCCDGSILCRTQVDRALRGFHFFFHFVNRYSGVRDCFGCAVFFVWHHSSGSFPPAILTSEGCRTRPFCEVEMGMFRM